MRTLLLICFVLLLSSCGSSDNSEVSRTADSRSLNVLDNGKSVFHRGNGGEPDTLDPHRSEETSASAILRDAFEGLVSETVDGDIEPGVAEQWIISDDGLSYTFVLRQNARWSNGDPVLADDFVAGFRRTVDPATASSYAQILQPIRNVTAIIKGERPPDSLGVQAIDDHTLRIELESPTPYLLQLLTLSVTYPLHRRSYAEFGDNFTRPENIVTNGAYVITDWVVNAQIRLEKNPYYHRSDSVAIDVVYYHNTEDRDGELRRYRAGELDYTYEIPNSQFGWIQENLADELHIEPYLSVYFYAFDLTEPPFNDVRLRQALTMAVDRKIITEQVNGLGEQPAFGIVPPGIAGYVQQQYDWAALSEEQRITEARRLYAEAGYSADNPLEAELRYNTSENHRRIAIAISSMWKQTLGAEIELVNQEWKVMLQDRQNPALWDLMRFGWVGDYNDPFTFLEIFRTGHGQNFAGFSSESFDSLLSAVSNERDLPTRAGIMADAERELINDYPVLPIYFYVNKHLVKPHVEGYRGNVLNHDLSRHYRIVRP